MNSGKIVLATIRMVPELLDTALQAHLNLDLNTPAIHN